MNNFQGKSHEPLHFKKKKNITQITASGLRSICVLPFSSWPMNITNVLSDFGFGLISFLSFIFFLLRFSPVLVSINFSIDSKMCIAYMRTVSNVCDWISVRHFIGNDAATSAVAAGESKQKLPQTKKGKNIFLFISQFVPHIHTHTKFSFSIGKSILSFVGFIFVFFCYCCYGMGSFRM